MEAVVNLCKRRGFVFPSAEIYGGFRSTYDYGPLGVLMLRNVKEAWWREMVQLRTDVVGLDAAILSPPAIWEASGHLATFTDPLVDCKKCQSRYPRGPAARGPGLPVVRRQGQLHRGQAVPPHVQDVRRPRGGQRCGLLPAARDRAGHVHQVQQRHDHVAA